MRVASTVLLQVIEKVSLSVVVLGEVLVEVMVAWKAATKVGMKDAL